LAVIYLASEKLISEANVFIENSRKVVPEMIFVIAIYIITYKNISNNLKKW
jgi:hypothetical protein